ncbi:hypothetical protein DPEC_G00066980 [Dallia pectoralis]|uniref:Uncharacterized protein n=1 Tax=Dallia pectoralis TaxID=75939 RepID=A0ACC2H9H5_DALPE|nr:hypothetical protein DPEC_G00066980 [Dallia pectoralis]
MVCRSRNENDIICSEEVFESMWSKKKHQISFYMAVPSEGARWSERHSDEGMFLHYSQSFNGSNGSHDDIVSVL